jgi:hypothetical protein
MNVYTVTLENVATGAKAPSMIVRRETEAEVLEYVADLLAACRTGPSGHLYAVLRVAEIVARAE